MQNGDPKAQSEPVGFDAFWSAYQPSPLSRRSAALQAWNETGAFRPPTPIIVACCKLYNQDLKAQASPGFTPGKMAPQNWLHERMWQGFEAKAHGQAEYEAAANRDAEAMHENWRNGAYELMEERIGPALFRSWFKQAFPRQSPTGKGTTVYFVKKLAAQMANDRFLKDLEHVFENPVELAHVPDGYDFMSDAGPVLASNAQPENRDEPAFRTLEQELRADPEEF